MIYYDTLNNAELFATYAYAKPAAWDQVIERVVTHREHGNGAIKAKEGWYSASNSQTNYDIFAS